MPIARRLVGQAVKVGASAADLLTPPRSGIVVLVYHRVDGGTRSEIDLPVTTFDEQMAWLVAHRRPVSLDEALVLLDAGEPASQPPAVVVTFDDGTADFVDMALPVLVRQGVPATLYLATDYAERQRPISPGATPVTWAGLAEAASTGLVTIASHTHTHALMDRLPTNLIADELDRSIDLIGERLGVSAQHFAYPKAVLGSEAAERAVRERFQSAALAGNRVNRYGHTDPHRLARSPIQVSDGRVWFRRKARGGMALEETLRERANRRRYAESST